MSWAVSRRMAACAAALATLVAIAAGLTGCAPSAWLTHHTDADANRAGAGGTGDGTFSDWPPYAKKGYDMDVTPTARQISIAKALLNDRQERDANVAGMKDGWPDSQIGRAHV